ncbi:MAG: hypothetical protein ACJZ45_02010 [Nitrospinia bacterium]
MMLNSFGKNQEKDVFTILKIKHWVQNYFELRGYENVLVTELKCHEERYSPVKTVIVILKEGTEKEQYKFHKRMDEINVEDIANLSTSR